MSFRTTRPAWTTEPTSGHWTRNISGIDGALVAIQSNGEAPVLQLTDLHGDVIGTAALSESETKLLSSTDTSEFGVPTTSTPAKYSWLGGEGLPTEFPTGVIAMGARAYVPQLGRFLQPDPSRAARLTPTHMSSGTRSANRIRVGNSRRGSKNTTRRTRPKSWKLRRRVKKPPRKKPSGERKKRSKRHVKHQERAELGASHRSRKCGGAGRVNSGGRERSGLGVRWRWRRRWRGSRRRE